MGTASRSKPKRLAEKLKMIRESLALTHEQMVMRLADSSGKLHRASISRFETGVREPSLHTLLSYARLANISTDVLIDDELDLPARLEARQGDNVKRNSS